MKVLLDLCIVPLGVGVSISRHVAACERVIIEAGLKYQLHANGTNIEGDWDRRTARGQVPNCEILVFGV